MTLIQCRLNVVEPTLHKRHVPAGIAPHKVGLFLEYLCSYEM